MCSEDTYPVIPNSWFIKLEMLLKDSRDAFLLELNNHTSQCSLGVAVFHTAHYITLLPPLSWNWSFFGPLKIVCVTESRQMGVCPPWACNSTALHAPYFPKCLWKHPYGSTSPPSFIPHIQFSVLPQNSLSLSLQSLLQAPNQALLSIMAKPSQAKPKC